MEENHNKRKMIISAIIVAVFAVAVYFLIFYAQKIKERKLQEKDREFVQESLLRLNKLAENADKEDPKINEMMLKKLRNY